MKNALRLSLALVAGALVAFASEPRGSSAEEPNPKPGLPTVVVQLCIESADFNNIYCDPGEVIASQVSETRTYPMWGGGEMTLPGTYQFTQAELNQAPGSPRAVVFGPIHGIYEGYPSAWIWGAIWKNGTLGQPYWLPGVPTELFRGALGNPSTGLDLSRSGEFQKEFAFYPHAQFAFDPYYVVVYLDQSVSGQIANPGIGNPNTLDGQVWGMDVSP